MKQVIAAGLKLWDGKTQVVELLAENRRYWIRLADGVERPLPRDAAKYLFDVIGDPEKETRKELP